MNILGDSPCPLHQKNNLLEDTKVKTNNSTTKMEVLTQDTSTSGEISKSQLKKKRRHERYLEQKAYRREQKKAKKKNGRDSSKRENESKVTQKENSGDVTLNQSEASRLQRSLRRREEFLQATEENAQVVIDCGFDIAQTAKELLSLSQQLMYTYGLNRNSSKPFRLAFVGISDELEMNLQRISGVSRWTAELSKKTLPDYCNLATLCETERNRFVYLTADSPTTLDTIEPDHVYIIGGLVDRNRFKHITLQKAHNLQLRTARLPIAEHITLMSSQVLTVNQVFAVLLHNVSHSGDWKKAISLSVPERKGSEYLKKRKQKKNDQENSYQG